MPENNHDETPAPILNAGTLMLHFHQRPEWKKVNFGGKYWDDFMVLGNHILLSQPSGYATLTDAEKSLKLNHEVVRVGIPEKTPYIQIEDYSNLTGSTLTARKHAINERLNWENLIAVIFCNASPMMKISVEFGKKIYSFPFDVHVSKSLPEAVGLAVEILGSRNIFYDPTFPIIEQKALPDIVSKSEWDVQNDGFSLKFEIIDGDILHPVPAGFPHKEYIDSIFEAYQRVFEESGLKDGAYYLMSDLAAMKDAEMETRRYFVQKLREWYHRHPFHMLIFYNANWIMRAAINISKTTAPYDVFVCKTFDEAMGLVIRHRSAKGSVPRPKAEPPGHGIDIDVKYFDELFNILADINWDSKSPESISPAVPVDHPFRQVIEAVSLIKLDVDHLLAEKEITEKALLESNERYKSILENMEEGYYEVDLTGNLTFFNSSLCTILGYSEKEMVGMGYRLFSSKNDISKIYDTFNRVLTTGHPATALDWKLIRKNGETCFIEASVALIKNNENQPCGFRGICRDISFRIEAEQEKQKMADRLRQAQKMEAIGTLAGGVAHDLNNILSGIVSYPELLLMKLPSASPLRKPLETIKKSGEKAAAIVADLLTLARRGLTHREVVNINAIITDYLKSPEHNYLLVYHPLVEIFTILDSQLLNISASSIHIIKILMNLISNAAEAMPDGGKIHIITENFYADSPLHPLSSLRKGEYVKFIVNDDGIGITDEDKERIFEPFYTKKIMGRSGSGLGMAMVWGSVQDHDGYIDIQSAPGKGTTITIYFPAIRTESPVEEEDISLDPYRGKGETILVVDDLKDQRELAADLLTHLGYLVKTFASGEAVIEYLTKDRADLVILDMIMNPGIDGLDTYKKIIAIRPSQKAIIATGFSTSERIQAAQALGAGPCLKKPYLLKDMSRVVREELDR